MCLYPRLIQNQKYIPNKKNNYNAPIPKDLRTIWVAVGCGNCIECRTQKARSWQVRLNNELQVNKYAYFVTLTFSEESLKNLCKENNTKESNAIATIAVRRFLERWRKAHKKSVKHWLITELGHNGTERIHLHGILFTEEELTNEKLEKFWQYGYSDIGKYCNEKTINYIIKYVTKIDQDHKGFVPAILCSAGLGKNYINEFTKNLHKYRPKDTVEYYKLSNGQKVNLPIYYRNKLFTEDEREKLWIDRLDQNTIYVRGIEIKNINTEKGKNEYFAILEEQQKQNKELGYGDTSKDWQKKEYNCTFKMLQNTRKGESVSTKLAAELQTQSRKDTQTK